LKNTIKKFVKETLGCSCPDEVFEHIELERDINLDNDILINAKINIGSRLLVYIMEVNEDGFLKNNLQAAVSFGKEERDRRGFNRFRLVLTGEKIDEFEQAAYTIFNDLAVKDEKMHMHVVGEVLRPFF
jgi:hypothetical protein